MSSITTSKLKDSYLSTDFVTNVGTTDIILQGNDNLATSEGVYNALSSLSIDLVNQLSTANVASKYKSKDITKLFYFKASSPTIDSIDIIDATNPKNAVEVSTDLLNIGLTGYSSSKYFRIPNIVRLSSGRLISIFDIRWQSKGDISQTRYNDQSIGMSYSDDEENWSLPKEIISWLYPIYDSSLPIVANQYLSGATDPGIVYDEKHNTVYVFAMGGKGFQGTASEAGDTPLSSATRQQLVMVWSNDDGETWSEPTTVIDKIYDTNGETLTWALDYAYLFSSCGTGITLKSQQNDEDNGKIFLPIQFHPAGNLSGKTDLQKAEWLSLSRFGLMQLLPAYDLNGDVDVNNLRFKLVGELIGEGCGGADEGQVCEGRNGELAAIVKSYRGITNPDAYASFLATASVSSVIFMRLYKSSDLGLTWTCVGDVLDNSTVLSSGQNTTETNKGNYENILLLLSATNVWNSINMVGFQRADTGHSAETYATNDLVYMIATTENDLANVNYSNIYLSSIRPDLYPALCGTYTTNLTYTDNALPAETSSLYFYLLSSVQEPFSNYKIAGHAPYMRNMVAKYASGNEPTFIVKKDGDWYQNVCVGFAQNEKLKDDVVCSTLEATYRLKPCICYSKALDLYIISYSNALYTSDESTYRRRYIMLRSSKDLCQWDMFDSLEVMDNMGYLSFVQDKSDPNAVECIYEAYNDLYSPSFAESTAKQIKFCKYVVGGNAVIEETYNHHQEVGYIVSYAKDVQGFAFKTNQFLKNRPVLVKGIKCFAGYNFSVDTWCTLYDSDSDNAKPIAYSMGSSSYNDNEVYYEFKQPVQLLHDSEYFLLFNTGTIPNNLPTTLRGNLTYNSTSKQKLALFASKYTSNMKIYNAGAILADASKSFVPCSARIALVLA